MGCETTLSLWLLDSHWGGKHFCTWNAKRRQTEPFLIFWTSFVFKFVPNSTWKIKLSYLVTTGNPSLRVSCALSYILYYYTVLRYDLPGRRRAGSMRSGLLVAPNMNTSPELLTPSISASNCDTTLQHNKSSLNLS